MRRAGLTFATLSCVAVLSMASTAVVAQTPSPPAATQPPAPRPTLSADISSYFEGRWAGSGTFTRSGKPLTSVFEFTTALGGEALQVRHQEDPPLIFGYLGLISIDSVSHDVVLLLAGNQSGGARLMRSKGWTGDTLIFESGAGLRVWFARERITFQRLDADHFRATYEMSADDGLTWRSGDVQTFSRVPPSGQAS
ncbi:hypothetical protein ACIQC9_12590 [Brevundimonas sp. NPDC092305]|uniref:hypothetical protein n=1 Tax=Brevundimonas sp. NPDC092305 TaxID=3363957 RepID=UPI00382948AC